MFHKILCIALLFFTAPIVSAAVDTRHDAQDKLHQLISHELSKKYPGARTEITSAVRWSKGGLPSKIESITLLGENARGELQFSTRGAEIAEGWVSYAAWVPARVALRRVHPGEMLSMDSFVTQDVNIATGQAFEYRGVILPRDTEVNGLEARQTILEGQFLTANQVRKVPDVRRGDMVRIHINTGGLVLSTTGTVDEAGYISNSVRVIANKTKRVLTGQLSAGRIVEVQL